MLARRWLSSIHVQKDAAGSDEAVVGGASDDDLGAVTELLEVAMPVAMADAEPGAVEEMRGGERIGPRLSPLGIKVRKRSASAESGDSSGIMVEEKGTSDDDLDRDEIGDGGGEERRRGGTGDGRRDEGNN